MLPELSRRFFGFLRAGRHPWQEEHPKFKGRFGEIFAGRDPERGASISKDELHTIYTSVLATGRLGGALAEFGVYRGASARLICELKGDRPLYLFDTFLGMPNEKISTEEDNWRKDTHTDTSLDDVKEYLKAYPAVHFVPGMFPESMSGHTGEPLADLTFSFVHLDVDLYLSTLAGLEFFYPRLVAGGRLVSHNYNLWKSTGVKTPGVKTAFMEYFKGDEHRVIEVAGTQCMVVKDGGQ